MYLLLGLIGHFYYRDIGPNGYNQDLPSGGDASVDQGTFTNTYDFFDAASADSNYVFMHKIVVNLFAPILHLIQRIGLWGAVINTGLLVVTMLYFQGNQKEMTRLSKSIFSTVIAFIFLISIVSWVQLFQNAVK